MNTGGVTNPPASIYTLFPAPSTFAPAITQPLQPINPNEQSTLPTISPEQSTTTNLSNLGVVTPPSIDLLPTTIAQTSTPLLPTLSPDVPQSTPLTATGIPETFPTPVPLETTIAETGFPIPPLTVDSNRDGGPQTGKFLLDGSFFNRQ